MRNETALSVARGMGDRAAQLSIAIKSGLHYEVCLGAKVCQVEEVFQAKLGWLVGNIYSRVGTPDWSAEELAPRVKPLANHACAWVEDKHVDKLRKVEKDRQKADS